MSSDEYFEGGYHTDRYYELEEDLIKFLRFMPLEIYNTPEKMEKVKSPYLADLLIRIGSNIDIFFRKLILSDYTDIDKERKSENRPYLALKDYKKLEPKFSRNRKKLSECKVKIIQTREYLIPFNNWDIETPNWWTSYNHVKHEALIEEANLNIIMHSLAAFFLLICFKKSSSKLALYNYLCVLPQYRGEILLKSKKEIQHDIITKLFISPVYS